MVEVDIAGLIYLIDENGNISKRRGQGFLKVFPDKDGYFKVSIHKGKLCHNEHLHHCIVYKA